MTITREQLMTWLVEDFDLDPGELGDGTGLFSGGLLDSFSMLQLVSRIEAAAGVKVRPMDFTLENLDSVDRMLAFIERRAGS
jgi:acyl carrier protein